MGDSSDPAGTDWDGLLWGHCARPSRLHCRAPVRTRETGLSRALSPPVLSAFRGVSVAVQLDFTWWLKAPGDEEEELPVSKAWARNWDRVTFIC